VVSDRARSGCYKTKEKLIFLNKKKKEQIDVQFANGLVNLNESHREHCILWAEASHNQRRCCTGRKAKHKLLHSVAVMSRLREGF
jgi:hypothetical protein